MTTKTTIFCRIGMPVLVGALLISGCGTTKQPPIEKIANAELAINRAVDGNAREFAPLELRSAQDNLQNANEFVQNEEYEKAARFAEQALLDATLAETKAEKAMATQAAKEMRDSIETLRQEINR